MSNRETVTEVLVEGRLRVVVPLERADELATGVQAVLESPAQIRYADVTELGAVDAGDDALVVTVDCRLTLHVDEPPADAATLSDSLRTLERVVAVDSLEIDDGPYRVERW